MNKIPCLICAYSIMIRNLSLIVAKISEKCLIFVYIIKKSVHRHRNVDQLGCPERRLLTLNMGSQTAFENFFPKKLIRRNNSFFKNLSQTPHLKEIRSMEGM